MTTITRQFQNRRLGDALRLRSGVVLRNRIVKAAMSDSLGDGRGNPTPEQIRLYQRWALGDAALAIIGEVQVTPDFAEKPGNLVLRADADPAPFRRLAEHGSSNGAHIWPQLGDWSCAEIEESRIHALPGDYAAAAQLARSFGFSGVQIHAGHGFLLSQFLSPLFNRRTDRYGGSIANRSRLLLEIVDAVRSETGSDFAVAVKINSSDQLENGLGEDDALDVTARLGDAGVDLIDISGGTYFPGAASSSDRRTPGPYFVDFARRARTVTDAALMTTGGFKTGAEARRAIDDGSVDLVGLARPLVLDPELATKWLGVGGDDPTFPHFDPPLLDAIRDYEARDADRVVRWRDEFDH